MKNQYFGDNRDLFKYDLILRIIQAGLVNHFIYIPMLTKNDDSKQGGERDRCKARFGWKNQELCEFLNEFEEESERDIRQLGRFFGKCGIKMKVYGRDFLHEGRKEYFEAIGNDFLSKSLIFVDPDIGLEINKRSREKHVLYCEVSSLHENMGESPILMIYRHFPRKNHEE